MNGFKFVIRTWLLALLWSCTEVGEFPAEVDVYPNPTSGYFNIELYLNKESEVIIQLINLEAKASILQSGPAVPGKRELI